MTHTTSIEEMAKLPKLSEAWFKAAFENCGATEQVKQASKRICGAYGITGQADPAYIANVIQAELNKQLL